KQALTHGDALKRTLEKQDRKQDLEQLVAILGKQAVRDVRIKANWQGNADLDLKVEEPTGSICSCLNRLTVGGGTLLGDSIADANPEEYAAAEAYNGEYKIPVDRRWGQPLGNKVQIVITLHDGSDDKVTRIETVKPGETITVKLDGGRRTSAATVPPPGAIRK